MSKELTPLEWLNYYKKKLQVSGQTFRSNGFELIETALKDYENLQLKHRSMQDAVLDDFKKLKALEIIKEKSVDVFQLQIAIKLTNLNEYNERHTKCLQLTQEEYDLLREVLL